jgi:predicted nucleotidyltransferase
MRHDSDIDVAVLLSDRVRRDGMFDYRITLASELGSALRRSDVDVVILNEASPLLAHRVLSKGKLIFERSPSARVRFQVKTAAVYSDLIPMFEMHIRYLKKSVREGRIIG